MSSLLKVLVVDDDPDSARLAERELGEASPPFATASAGSLAEALRLCEGGTFDVVLLDLNLPDSQGLDTFSRFVEAVPGSAVVILSGGADETIAMRAVQGGAQDYLLKGPMDARLLARTVRYAHERMNARHDQERLKEEFLHHVSHELRSPLTAIYQAVQLIADGIGGEVRPEQKRLVDIAVRNAEHLKSMIDDLLETTRAETGKLVVEPRRVDAARLAADVAAEKRLAADERRVGLSSAGGAVPPAFADPVRVRQVLMNLVDNALKFTPPGGAVAVGCARDPASPGRLVLSVSDTGPGLSPEDARRVFDRLYQARNVRPAAGERKGLGLGLFISKEIVMRSGGRLWVESEQGKGSVFKFTLPVFSFDALLAPLRSGGARPARAAAAFVAVYPSDHCLAEGSARTVRLEVAALLNRRARDGEVLLPEMSSSGTEGMLVFVARNPSDGGAALAERLRADLAGSRILALHRLKPVVEVETVEAAPETLAGALERAVTARLAARAKAFGLPAA